MFNIVNSLNDIKELYTKNGVTLSTVSYVDPLNRKNVSKVTRTIKSLSNHSLANILKDELLINRYNVSSLNEDIYSTLLDFRDFSKAYNVATLSDEEIINLYNIYNNELEKSTNYYNPYVQKKESLKYAISYYNDIFNLKMFFKNFFDICTSYEFYQTYNIDNSDYILLGYKSFNHLDNYKTTKFSLIERLNKVDNIHNLLKLLDKYLDVINDMNLDYDVDNSHIKLLLNSYGKSNNKNKFIENLNYLLDNNINSNLIDIFSYMYYSRIITDREFNSIIDNKDIINCDNLYSVIYKEGSNEEKILNSLTSYRDSKKIKFIKNAILNRKKAFLKLIVENISLFQDIKDESILFSKEFTEIVNINTLNVKDLEKISKISNNNDNMHHIRISANNNNMKLTFQEYEFLLNTCDINFDIFFKLLDLSIDERLRKCKQLPNQYPTKLISKTYKFEDKLYNFIKNNNLQIKKKELGIKNCSVLDVITYYINIDLCEKYKDQITSGEDIRFIVENKEYLDTTDSLQLAKYNVCKDDKSFKYLLHSLDLSNEFVSKHFNNLYTFYTKGLTNVYMALNNNPYQNSRQLKNLKLLTKAEIAGKLKDVKFVDEDFEKEIGLDISDSAKKEWKINRTNHKYYNVHETYDYNDIIRLGEIPVATCQHWDGGSYSRCLLSNFDSNKKMIVAKNSNGDVIARSLLRLTKGSNKYTVTSKNKLNFIDIDNVDITSKDDNNLESKNNEELVLFLERIYSPYYGDQLTKIEEQFISLAREKAKELGAKLIISTSYDNVDEDLFEKKDYYIFISYSKNGYQYLDSIGGQESESSEGSYKPSYLYIQK